MRSTYFITVSTEEATQADYTSTAGALVSALQKVLTDAELLCTLTKCGDLTDATTDVEVKWQEPSTVVARALIELHAEVPKLPLDKNRLTTALKAELPFAVKVAKRAVPNEELDRAIEEAA